MRPTFRYAFERSFDRPIRSRLARCLDLGLEGWACATNTSADGARVALGFDAIGRPCRIKTRGELALVRMALDTILQAVARSAIEKERTRLEARLQQARRMEKIGTFTSGIAHNYNNILGGVLGHSEVMEEYGGSDGRFAHHLAAIRRGAERARDLVDQILAFGRRRDARRKPLSVGALIAETASLLGVSLPKGIELVIRSQHSAMNRWVLPMQIPHWLPAGPTQIASTQWWSGTSGWPRARSNWRLPCMRWPIVAEEIAMALAHGSALTHLADRPLLRPARALPTR
jgi:signal transduction histidine kinase